MRSRDSRARRSTRSGICRAEATITTAVLLDAKAHVGRGKPMGPGELVTSKHIEEMLRAQGLSRRGMRRGPRSGRLLLEQL